MYLSLIQFNDLVDLYNITPADILLRDYLPDCHPTPLSRNGKQYEIERYQGDHASEYCVYEMNNGIRNGTAQLFDDGVLKLKWNMKNGVRDGSYVLFDKGIVVREGKWNDLGKEEERVITNHQSGLKMTIRHNGNIVYEGNFDGEMKRNGYGFEYANGVLKCYGKWKDDQLVEVKQRFLSPSEMIEYAAGATSYLLSHQPVYVGGYEMDEASGIVNRNGHGRVMDPDTGICDYESEWENGKEIESKRISLHDGWYHVPMSNQPMIATPSIIPSPLTIETLTIGDNSLCDPTVSTLHLSNLPNLKSIEIGDNCGVTISDVLLEFLDSFHSLRIGKKSFTTCESNWPIERSNRTFTIHHCLALESIEIGESSFSDYSSFSLTDLPFLSTLSLQSHSFIFSPILSLTSNSVSFVNRRFTEAEIGFVRTMLLLLLSFHSF